MSWRLGFSKNAEKFLEYNNVSIEEVRVLLGRMIQYFQGENINIDVRKLKGKWARFYRIRSGRMRIIVEFDLDNSSIFIEEIDWRGNIY